jgi:hypothetical protein
VEVAAQLERAGHLLVRKVGLLLARGGGRPLRGGVGVVAGASRWVSRVERRTTGDSRSAAMRPALVGRGEAVGVLDGADDGAGVNRLEAASVEPLGHSSCGGPGLHWPSPPAFGVEVSAPFGTGLRPSPTT